MRWLLIMITLTVVTLGACQSETPLDTFRREMRSYDFTDRVLCIGNDTPDYIARYNEALLTGIAALLAEGAEPDQIEPILTDAETLTIGDTQDGNVLAQVWLRRCRAGSHDSRLSIPAIVVFDHQGHYWQVAYGTLGPEPGWADDRWYFVSTWLNPMAGQGDSSRLLHIVHTGESWEARLFITLNQGPWLGLAQIDFVAGYRKIRVQTTGSRVVSLGPPCDLDLGEGVDYINTVYSGTITMAWTGDTYQLTGETPFEARIVAHRGGDPVTLNDWRAWCA